MRNRVRESPRCHALPICIYYFVEALCDDLQVMVLRAIAQEHFVQERGVAEVGDDHADSRVRLLRQMSVHQFVQELTTLADSGHQECSVIGEVHLVETNDGQGCFPELGAQHHSSAHLVIIELSVLVEQANLDHHLDHVLNDFVRFLLVLHFIPQYTVENVQELAKIVIDELLGNGLVGKLAQHFLLDP